jgi:hypothetical protein
MSNLIGEMLKAHHALQLIIPPKGIGPESYTGDERANYLTWNAYALEDELHEATQETGWKPWASSRHLNGEAMLKEMVDAWHFFMNILMVIGAEMGWSLDELADEFTEQYFRKNQVNRDRHAEGNYTGLNKCANCSRDLGEIPPNHHSISIADAEAGDLDKKCCSSQCASERTHRVRQANAAR